MTTQTMVRTQIAVDDHSYYLAPHQDLREVERRIEDAVHAGGRFVRFVVVGDHEMSVLFTPHTRVAASVETVPVDGHDVVDAGIPQSEFCDE